MNFAQTQLSAHTKKAYSNDLGDFFYYLKKQNLWDSWTTSVGSADVARYREYLTHQKDCRNNTVIEKSAVLKSFYKWAEAEGYLKRNPALLVKAYPQSQESKTSFLNEGEIYRLLNYFKPIYQCGLGEALANTIIQTLLMLGLRRSEAASIRFEHMEWNGTEWLVHVQGKGARIEVFAFTLERAEDTRGFWIGRIYEEAPQFTTLKKNIMLGVKFFDSHSNNSLLITMRSLEKGQSISTSEIARLVRKYSLKAGIIQKVSPHMLRATAITYALDQGASSRGVQQMAGWTTPLMMARYDRYPDGLRFSAIRKLKYANERKSESEV